MSSLEQVSDHLWICVSQIQILQAPPRQKKTKNFWFYNIYSF